MPPFKPKHQHQKGCFYRIPRYLEQARNVSERLRCGAKTTEELFLLFLVSRSPKQRNQPAHLERLHLGSGGPLLPIRAAGSSRTWQSSTTSNLGSEPTQLCQMAAVEPL